MAGPEITDVGSCSCNNTTVARRAHPEKDNRQQPVAFLTTFSSLLFRRGLLLGRHRGKVRSVFFSLTACNPSDWDKQREKEGKEEQLAREKEREERDEEKEEQEEEDFVILITSDESLVFHSTSLVFSSSVYASQRWRGGRTAGIRSFLLLLFSRRSYFIARHKGGGTAATVSEGRLSFSSACAPVCCGHF